MTKTLPKPTNNKLTKSATTKPLNTRQYVYDSSWLNNELSAIIELLKQHETICTKAEIFALLPYTNKTFQHRLKSAKALEDINGKISKTRQLMDKVEEILEARLINRGLTAKNFPFVIFLLKNHYGYQDKREVETETTHIFKVSRGQEKLLKSAPIQLKASSIKTNKNSK